MFSLLNLSADQLRYESSCSPNEYNDYLRGYKTLDKEIELLVNKKLDNTTYNNQIVEVSKQLQLLKANTLTDRLIAAFENTPIKNNQFKAVKFDTSQMKLQKISHNAEAIIITFIILGFVLSAFVVLIREEIL